MPSPMTTECRAHECRRVRAEMQAEIDRLRTEVGELHMHAKRRDEYAIEKAAETLAAVKRANAAEADAERYRWLRTNEQDRSDAFLANCDEELDAAIDAARSDT